MMKTYLMSKKNGLTSKERQVVENQWVIQLAFSEMKN